MLSVEANERDPGRFRGELDLNGVHIPADALPLRVRALVHAVVDGRDIAGDTLLTSRHGTWPRLHQVCTAIAPSPASVLVRVTWTPGGGVELVSLRSRVQLVAVEYDDHELVVRLQTGSGSKPPELALRSAYDPEATPRLVRGVALSSSDVEFHIDRRTLRGDTAWHVQAHSVSEGGQSIALTEETRRSLLPRGIAADIDRAGELFLLVECSSPILTEVRLTGAGLYVDVVPRRSMPTVRLREQGSVRDVPLRTSPQAADGIRSFTAWLPLADLPSSGAWHVLYVGGRPATVAPWVHTEQDVRFAASRAILRGGRGEARLRVRTRGTSP